jgi:hypothetical protein
LIGSVKFGYLGICSGRLGGSISILYLCFGLKF